MKLIQVGLKQKCALMDVTIFPSQEFTVLRKHFFFFLACEGIWLLLYCYEAAKALGQIPAGMSGQGDGLFSFLLSVSVLVRIISYIYFFVFV